MAILRGFHHTYWTTLLRETWVPPVKDADGKPLGRRKDPLQQSVLLIKCAWDLFEAVWECRNGILHSNQNKLEVQAEEDVTSAPSNDKTDS